MIRACVCVFVCVCSLDLPFLISDSYCIYFNIVTPLDGRVTFHGRFQGSGTGGGCLSNLPLENNRWLQVSLEIMVRTTLEKQLDSASPIASPGRLVCPSVNFRTTYAIFRIRPLHLEFILDLGNIKRVKIHSGIATTVAK